MIISDVRNNSAWNQRFTYYTRGPLHARISRVTPPAVPTAAEEGRLHSELQYVRCSIGVCIPTPRPSVLTMPSGLPAHARYVLSKVGVAPNNEAAWNYLRGYGRRPFPRHPFPCRPFPRRPFPRRPFPRRPFPRRPFPRRPFPRRPFPRMVLHVRARLTSPCVP